MKIRVITLNIFILFFIVAFPAVLDFVHGYLDVEKNVVVLSSLYRGAIFFFMLSYLIKLRAGLLSLTFSLFLSVFLFGAFFWAINDGFNLARELSSLVSLLYFLVSILFFRCFFIEAKIDIEYAFSFLRLYGVLTGVVLVLSLVFGIGIPTYSTPDGVVYGFGTESYYSAGNVVGITLICALISSIYLFIQQSNFKSFFLLFVIYAGLISIGTRTGIAISSILVFLFLAYFFFLHKGFLRFRIIVFILVVPVLMFAGFKIYEFSKNYETMTTKFSQLATGNVRGVHKSTVEEYLSDRTLSETIMGEGYSVYTENYIRYSPKKGELAVAEQDVHDVLGAYGLLGVLLIFGFMISVFLMAIITFYYRSSTQLFFCIVLLTAILGHSVLAGHVVFSTKSNQFAALVIALTLCVITKKLHYFRNRRKNIDDSY